MLTLLLLVACHPVKDGPLGIPLGEGTWAGAVSIDVTPDIPETFTDRNGNHDFDGCLDDPTASRPGCAEPFDDANGNGWFDAVFIGGFGPMRPANGVHDPITVRAVVIASDRAYLAIASMDLVGLGSPRIEAARAALEADGFAGDHLVASASHNHQGPDSMGLWGNPYDLSNPITGRDPAYQQRLTDAIEQAVRDAAAEMEPVTLRVGSVRLRDRSPYFTGAVFGGKSPDPRQLGLIHDGRDPVVVSDQLLALQGRRDDGTVVFTLTNWSGHPEVRGSGNNELSADWIGVTRPVLEDAFPGSVALHVPECLGGMQSALGGEMPLVTDDGTHVHQTCDAAAVADAADASCFGAAVGSTRVDADGLEVPVWAEHDSWAFVTSHGWHIAEAAIAALEDGEDVDAAPIRVDTEPVYVPVENLIYQILGPQDMFDLNLTDLEEDPALCPESAGSDVGCLRTRTSRLQVGPVTFLAVPGELLPELFWGFPDEERWADEAASPQARGPDSAYFPQHDHDCDALDYARCQTEAAIGDCDCLAVHAWPYVLTADDAAPMGTLPDTAYRAVIGMADDYLSYIVPEPDFNRDVTLLSDRDGDHYEDTVSPGHTFGTRVIEAQRRIDARWTSSE